MPTLIRDASPQDLPELFQLLRGKAEFDGNLPALKATVETLGSALFAAPPLTFALVAFHDDAAVGMAIYHPIFSSFLVKPGLWLDDLFVYQQYRGRGIGRDLLVRLCQIAEAQGCARVDWLVSKNNLRGINFYQSIGGAVSERGRLVRLDAAALVKLANGG
jgi:GNAT superfamily N-acetyltransferase